MSGPEQRVGGPVADERARVIAEVLFAHRARPVTGTFLVTCKCADRYDRSARVGRKAHEAHVAAAIAAALPTPTPETGICAEFVETGDCDHSDAEHDRIADGAPAPAGEDATLTPGREALGRLVRKVWVEWAREQESPKPSWLVDWEGLSEPDREVDRRIGARLYAEGAQRGAADQATLAAVRAACQEALHRFGTVRHVEAAIEHVLSALDGPDAGGGRRG